MEFADLKISAERWLGEHDSKFKLTSFDANENRLIFSNPDSKVSFNIICPNKEESWSVCSEEETILVKLQDVMEYLDSKVNLTIDMVLTRISINLTDLASSHSTQPCGSSQKDATQEEDMCDEDDFEGAEEGDDDDDDNDMDCYYGEEDPDAEAEPKKEEEKDDDEDLDADMFFTEKGASPVSVQRLVKDLKNINKQGDKYGFTAGPQKNNLFKWDVKLVNIPEDTKLGKDLKKFAQTHNTEAAISMEMQFPCDYPYSPPFLRVVRPRFRFLTGHVTIGGSICMEMLTKSGWRPCNDIEGILVQVRSEILSDPKASLHDTQANHAYSELEAKDAFDRMVNRYGWNK